jgi:hypothetical protein
MLSILCGMLALVPWLPLFPNFPRPSQSGVNKATFDKIKSGMTAQEVQALIGRKPDGIWGSVRGLGYSEMEVYDTHHIRVLVEYEPTVTNGKVTRAFFYDYSTTVSFELRRVATADDRRTVVDQLIADAKTKMPLDDSVAFSKGIPVDEARAIKYIEEHPDYQSYHLLLALRNTNLKAYKSLAPEIRAAVLCSTLREQDFFDDWMPPDCTTADQQYASNSEKALVEIGIPTILYLLPLLDDHSVAQDSEYEEEPEFEYRRADYAFRYICWILKLPDSFQPEPEDRDKAIRCLKMKLAGAVRFVELGGN